MDKAYVVVIAGGALTFVLAVFLPVGPDILEHIEDQMLKSLHSGRSFSSGQLQLAELTRRAVDEEQTTISKQAENPRL